MREKTHSARIGTQNSFCPAVIYISGTSQYLACVRKQLYILNREINQEKVLGGGSETV